MNNVKIGNATEKKIIQLLRDKNYWIYNTPHKVNGQPVDIIAIRKNSSWLIDAKHVEQKSISFPFDRIEPNQITTCIYANSFAGIENIGFAIDFDRDGQVYWLPFNLYQELNKTGCKSIKMTNLRLFKEVLEDENQHYNI